MRRDIQFLRGIAVLLVVLYHGGLGVFDRGYLGVDVFFVISGFLITTIILEGLENGTFSFSRFYLRRAKRLLPALYSTLLLTTAVAFAVLTPGDRKDFAIQLIGSLTFVANMVLPTQIGYFAAQSESVPLLHIWSLSLEEQYYFTLPLFCFLVPRRWRLPALILAFTCSIVWCVAWAMDSGPPPFLWRLSDSSRSEWAFFLFPTRAWELLAGSICAWIMRNKKNLVLAPPIKWACVIAILVVSSRGIDSLHPRGDAIAVVLATALLLLGDDEWFPRSSLLRGIERVGDWSYSIYLVHWPLFVFAHIVYLEQVPPLVKGALVVAALFLGFLQYRYVETPFRYQWQRPIRLVWQEIALASLALLVAPLGLLYVTSQDAHARDRMKDVKKVNYGLSEKCEGSFDGTQIKSECVIGERSRLAVWGDSYAMHLVPGLSIANPNLVQLTKSVCGPIVGLAPVLSKYNEAWARGCVLHNERSLALILNSPEITHVVLSSSFDAYFGTGEGRFLLGERTIEKDADVARQYLDKTIKVLRQAGKEPIVVSPPPRAGYNIGSCLEREDRGLWFIREGCNIGMDEYMNYDRSINSELVKLADQTGVRLIWLRDLSCKDDWCQTRIHGRYLYRDGGHLSIEGSSALLGGWHVGADLASLLAPTEN